MLTLHRLKKVPWFGKLDFELVKCSICLDCACSGHWCAPRGQNVFNYFAMYRIFLLLDRPTSQNQVSQKERVTDPLTVIIIPPWWVECMPQWGHGDIPLPHSQQQREPPCDRPCLGSWGLLHSQAMLSETEERAVSHYYGYFRWKTLISVRYNQFNEQTINISINLSLVELRTEVKGGSAGFRLDDVGVSSCIV